MTAMIVGIDMEARAIQCGRHVFVTLSVFGHAMRDLNDRGSWPVRGPSICGNLQLIPAREPELFAIHRRSIIAIWRTNSTAALFTEVV